MKSQNALKDADSARLGGQSHPAEWRATQPGRKAITVPTQLLFVSMGRDPTSARLPVFQSSSQSVCMKLLLDRQAWYHLASCGLFSPHFHPFKERNARPTTTAIQAVVAGSGALFPCLMESICCDGKSRPRSIFFPCPSMHPSYFKPFSLKHS